MPMTNGRLISHRGFTVDILLFCFVIEELCLISCNYLKEEDPAVTCFCLTPDDEKLIVSSENGLLRLWDWKNSFLSKSWKVID